MLWMTYVCLSLLHTFYLQPQCIRYSRFFNGQTKEFDRESCLLSSLSCHTLEQHLRQLFIE